MSHGKEATSAINEEELAIQQTPGYKLGEKKTLDEYAKLDAEDESLNKWKASLGIGAGGVPSGSGPKIELLKLSLQAESLNKPIEFDLKQFAPEQSKEDKELRKKNPITIKEGVEYNVALEFKVNHDIISGLKYVQVAKRAGMVLDKMQQMLGSYGPREESYVKKFDPEESPSGMLARTGSYAVRSRILDDDGNVYLDFDWSFKLGKDW